MYCTADELANESDVEQKFLVPLLTTAIPSGLGYGTIDYRTKPDIRRLKLDKGKSEKLYHPDYAIVIAGIPVFIIEAKHPDEDPVEALREARLYAVELNASFPPGVNPCQRIVASNGLMTVSATVDSAVPDLSLSLEDCSPSSPLFKEFVDRLSRTAAQASADKIRNELTIRPLHRAINFLGGRSARDEDVGYNDFGSKLAIDYRHVFNPENRKDRAHIVRNAYVPSQRREHYVDEIDRIIKTAVSISVPGAKLIANTEKPDEIISTLRAGRSLENEIMLLVGARGAGKSTFIDYCKEVQLPPDVIDSTVWVHLNLNDAPSEKSMIERWLLEETIASLRREHTDIDFDADIQKVFGVEVSRLKKGPLAVLDSESEAFKTRLADQLLTLQGDPLVHAKAMARYLAGERRKLLVVVFDNCDKRERDEQLQAFQSARWLQQQIRCLVILPIRDVTYDMYKEEPPLDTMIKDLVFRIDPPSFTRILRKRLDLVLSELSANTKDKMLEYTLENGIPVRYPANEIGFYLASIFRSLYDYDRLVRSLILGLAGRDIRRAMEIFLEFCRSGHIGPVEYLKIKTQKGQYCLPYAVVSRVLLRRNRRFYDGDSSFLKNLFQCHPDDARPDVFVRADILEWLRTKYREHGPTGVKGFHQCSALISDLMPLGHDVVRIRSEIDYLVRHGCIIAEHQRRQIESDDDLVRLSPSGFVHLNLVSEIGYLSACSEETWVEDESLAKQVADRIARFGPKVHYSPLTVAANASAFVNYLAQQQRSKLSPKEYLERGFSGVELDTDEVVVRAKRAIAKERKARGWDDFDERFAVGMECSGTVDGIQQYGVFVKLDGGPTGLMYFRNLPPARPVDSFEHGKRLVAEILDIQIEAQKVSLRFVRDESDSA